MPPLVSESEGETSGSEQIIPVRKGTPKGNAKEEDLGVEEVDESIEASHAEDGKGDDEEDEDDEDEEVYQVEKILAHAWDFPDKQVRYQIKWLGYDKEEDLTWETEDNLQGAKELLQKYFEKQGGRPVAPEKGGSSKKRGRKSAGADVDTPEQPAKKAKSEEPTKKKDGRGRKKKSEIGATVEMMDLARSKDGWEPPKPLPGAWEDGVLSVATIEGSDDGTKWAYLMWADEVDGKKRQTKALLKTCYVACPQIMLKFFESHLVFTDKHENRDKAEKAKKLNGKYETAS